MRQGEGRSEVSRSGLTQNGGMKLRLRYVDIYFAFLSVFLVVHSFHITLLLSVVDPYLL